MWVRGRKVAFAALLLSSLLAFQPTVSAATLTQIPTEECGSAETGIVVLEVHDDYVVVDVSTTNPDVIHIPIYTLPDGVQVAKGLLRKSASEEEALLTLTQIAQGDNDKYALVMNQDWPQNWNKLIINLGEQDWPQYEEVIVPLDFQDWPQSWLPAILA